MTGSRKRPNAGPHSHPSGRPIQPPTIVLFVRGGDLEPGYVRFLENRLRDEYDFTGTPIRMYQRRRHSKRPEDMDRAPSRAGRTQ